MKKKVLEGWRGIWEKKKGGMNFLVGGAERMANSGSYRGEMDRKVKMKERKGKVSREERKGKSEWEKWKSGEW